MTREEMWKEFENQLIRETRTPITVSYDVSERMIKSAIEETVAKWKERLEHEPCDDAISRKEVTQSRPEWLSEDVERDTDEQTVVDRAFNRGWNSCLKEFLKNIKELPSITPQQRVGRWINKYAEDACGERYSYWACSECGRDVGFNLANIEDVLSDYPYCHCGAKMVESQESEG